MSTLQSKINDLADQLTASILAAVRGASITELMDVTSAPKSTGTSAPSKPKSTGDVSATVFALLKNHPDGLRSEQIQKLAGIAKPAAVKAITSLLGSKHIKKTGQRRSTTYFAK